MSISIWLSVIEPTKKKKKRVGMVNYIDTDNTSMHSKNRHSWLEGGSYLGSNVLKASDDLHAIWPKVCGHDHNTYLPLTQLGVHVII